MKGIEAATLRERRERGLNDIAAVIEELWGPRCSRQEAGCATCMAWALFDCMASITEGTALDERGPPKEPSP